jgi:hypothetical protein
MFMKRKVHDAAGCSSDRITVEVRLTFDDSARLKRSVFDNFPPHLNSSRIFYEILNEVVFRVG